MNRSEHLQWCKDRAMEYVQQNDITTAVASFLSDMGKHPETEGHAALGMGMMLLMSGNMDNTADAEKWIQGFN